MVEPPSRRPPQGPLPTKPHSVPNQQREKRKPTQPEPRADQQKKRQTKPTILVITDSNGKLINAPQLKPEANVLKDERYTTQLAIDGSSKS